MNYPGHNFNRIVDIEQILNGIVQITTLYDHGYDTNTKGIRMTNTNCTPSIDGYHLITITGTDTFTISFAQPLTSPGFFGMLLSDWNFYLYNVGAFGGFASTELNNTVYTIHNI
ncbi:hypothetical protein HDU81_002005, partial [Chytriomyces hyalinus]